MKKIIGSQTIYQAVTNTLPKAFLAKKNHQELRLVKSPRLPQNTQTTLFARQMKQYETTKAILNSPKPNNPNKNEKN